MSRLIPCVCAAALLAEIVPAAAQPAISGGDALRVQEAIGAAFEFLYKMPSDESGAAMGTWVRDSAETTSPDGSADVWRIVVTRLTDTGDALAASEMTAKGGTSPRELAAAMQAMAQLEAKISKAEAEASLDVRIVLNSARVDARPDAGGDDLANAVVNPATSSWRSRGRWTKQPDRELGISVERWSPGHLHAEFRSKRPQAIESITVDAEGSDEMLDRLVNDARWDRLAALFQ